MNADHTLLVPTDIDGEPVSPAISDLLGRLQLQLDHDPKNRRGLKQVLEALASFLASPQGRTNANCVATDSVLMGQISEHPRYQEIPDDFLEILFDMGGALHDTISAPHIAKNFSSTPEQLLERIRRLAP